MSNAFPHPEVIGTLNPAEAAVFSQDFENNWEAIPPAQRIISAENFCLFYGDAEPTELSLPVTHEQFRPAIQKVVAHERTVRNGQLLEVQVTTRQTVIEPGQSQQGNFGNEVHRDNAVPDYFYTVSDTTPTRYYPDIVSNRDVSSFRRLPPEELEQGIAFEPYDIVRASTMMFHRSPTVTTPTRRTFLRLSFHYAHHRM